MTIAYVIKKRGKWLVGHSYGSGVGFSCQWTSNPFEARLYSRCPTFIPNDARAVRVRVSSEIAAALRPEDG